MGIVSFGAKPCWRDGISMSARRITAATIKGDLRPQLRHRELGSLPPPVRANRDGERVRIVLFRGGALRRESYSDNALGIAIRHARHMRRASHARFGRSSATDDKGFTPRIASNVLPVILRSSPGALLVLPLEDWRKTGGSPEADWDTRNGVGGRVVSSKPSVRSPSGSPHVPENRLRLMGAHSPDHAARNGK